MLVFIWTLKDVIGLSIIALGLLVIAFLFIRAAILDKIASWKRKRAARRKNK